MQLRPCDCFFLVGTNFGGEGASTESWNAPVPDPVCDEWCDFDSCLASAFNNRCRIFAPRYRQSIGAAHNHLTKASAPEPLRQSALQAFELAYSDVKRAFGYFVSQTGDRPIIIASHSQGSMHATRLMETFEHDSDLRRRLVCAYILGPCGFFLANRFERFFPSLHPCSGPLDTKCIVSFDTMSVGRYTHVIEALKRGEKQESPFPARMLGSDPCRFAATSGQWESPEGGIIFCTNPLTWTSGPGRADAALYLGRARICSTTDAGTEANFGDCKARRKTGVRVLGIDKVDAGGANWAEIAVDVGVLLVPGSEGFLHDEWEQWYFNIRENVAQRVDNCVVGDEVEGTNEGEEDK